MRTRTALLALALITLAGCVLPIQPSSETGTPRYELLSYMTFGSHEHDGFVTRGEYLLPNGTAPVPPARCTALRGTAQDPNDSCEVRLHDPSLQYGEAATAPWTILATWKQRTSDTTAPTRSVQASDAEGRTTAVWSGALAKNHGYVTE